MDSEFTNQIFLKIRVAVTYRFKLSNEPGHKFAGGATEELWDGVQT